MGFEDVAQGILVFCVGVSPKQAPQRLRMFPYRPYPAWSSSGCDGGPQRPVLPLPGRR